MLQSLQGVPHAESHLLFHQLLERHQVIQKPSVVQAETRTGTVSEMARHGAEPCQKCRLLQVQDQHEAAVRLVGVQEGRQLRVLDVPEDVSFLGHLLLPPHLLTHVLHCHFLFGDLVQTLPNH